MEYTGSVRVKTGKKNGTVSYQIVIEGRRERPCHGKANAFLPNGSWQKGAMQSA